MGFVMFPLLGIITVWACLSKWFTFPICPMRSRYSSRMSLAFLLALEIYSVSHLPICLCWLQEVHSAPLCAPPLHWSFWELALFPFTGGGRTRGNKTLTTWGEDLATFCCCCLFFWVVILVLVLFKIWSLYIAPAIFELCRLSCLQTHKDSPASATRIVRA